MTAGHDAQFCRTVLGRKDEGHAFGGLEVAAGRSQRPWRYCAIALTLVTGLLAAACQTVPEPPPAPAQPELTAPRTIETTPLATDVPAPVGSGVRLPFQAGEPVRIALLLPLSSRGGASATARSLLDSATLALMQSNDRRLMLMPRDTRGTAEGAAEAAREAVADGAELIIGPLFASEVQAVAPIARGAGLPVIAFSTDRTVAGNGVYLLSFQPEEDVSRVVEYAARTGRRSLAALVPANAYGQRVQAALATESAANAIQLAAIQSYPDAPEEAANAIPALGEGYDAVLLAAGGDHLKALAPAFAMHGKDVTQLRFMGTGLWNDSETAREPALVGSWFPGPPESGRAGFIAAYRDAYGKAPPAIASLGYDAMTLAALLARDAQRFSPSALTDPSGFSGIDGLFRFRPDGSTERGLAIYEVTGTGFAVVDPAPLTFAIN